MSRPPAPITGNPWLLTPDELRALSAGRVEELSLLRERLLADRAARELVVGDPGSGRSFLLARLALALSEEPELASRHAWVRLDDLAFLAGTDGVGEAIVVALAELEARRGNQARAESLRAAELRRAGESWGLLREWTRLELRGLVVLVDELDQGLEALDDGGRGLGVALASAPGISIIGSGRRTAEPAPLGMTTLDLAPLTESVARELMSRLAAPRGASAVLDVMNDPGRSRALLSLAAGNPAALVQLFEVLALGDADDLGSVAERWLDRATPAYALRLGALAHQARRVALGLATRADPSTAAELSQTLGLDVNAVSSQLSRLGKLGALDRVDLPDSGRTGFLLSDRRFDAWLRCRASGEARQDLRERVRFLALLHGADAGEARLGRRVPAAWAIEEWPEAIGWGALSRAIDAPSGIEIDPLPRSLPPLDPSAAGQWGRLGDLRKNTLRHFAEAEEAYQRALGLDRSLAWVWNNLGNLLRREFLRPDAAEAAYRGAIGASPGLAIAWLNLGNVLGAEAGRVEEGEQAVRRALALESTRAESWGSLAELLALQGRGREAAQALEEALARDPADPALWRALARLREEHGPATGVEQAWREAVRRGPEDPDASTGLGLFLARRGLATAAERALRRAIGLRARSPVAWRALGELLSGNEARLSEAEAALRQALDASPRGPAEMSAELGLAWFLLATGRAPEEAESRAGELARRVSTAGPQAVLIGARLRRGAWAEAVPLLRRLLGSGPWTEGTFHMVLSWLLEGARAGHAAEAAGLLAEAGLSRAWRPLYEALLAAAGDARRLQRLSPETRLPAEALLSRVHAHSAEAQRDDQQAPRRGRRPKRAW